MIDHTLPAFFFKSTPFNKNSLIIPQMKLGFLNLTYSEDNLRNSDFSALQKKDRQDAHPTEESVF